MNLYCNLKELNKSVLWIFFDNRASCLKICCLSLKSVTLTSSGRHWWRQMSLWDSNQKTYKVCFGACFVVGESLFCITRKCWNILSAATLCVIVTACVITGPSAFCLSFSCFSVFCLRALIARWVGMHSIELVDFGLTKVKYHLSSLLGFTDFELFNVKCFLPSLLGFVDFWIIQRKVLPGVFLQLELPSCLLLWFPLCDCGCYQCCSSTQTTQLL